jgi:hypothetical protein
MEPRLGCKHAKLVMQVQLALKAALIKHHNSTAVKEIIFYDRMHNEMSLLICVIWTFCIPNFGISPFCEISAPVAS